MSIAEQQMQQQIEGALYQQEQEYLYRLQKERKKKLKKLKKLNYETEGRRKQNEKFRKKNFHN